MTIGLETCPMSECNLSPHALGSLLKHLAACHAHFAPAFAHERHAWWAEHYLHGLLSTCDV